MRLFTFSLNLGTAPTMIDLKFHVLFSASMSGLCIVATGPWLDAPISYILPAAVVRLNYSRGFVSSCNTVSHWKRLGAVRGLNVVEPQQIDTRVEKNYTTSETQIHGALVTCAAVVLRVRVAISAIGDSATSCLPDQRKAE